MIDWGKKSMKRVTLKYDFGHSVCIQGYIKDSAIYIKV